MEFQLGQRVLILALVATLLTFILSPGLYPRFGVDGFLKPSIRFVEHKRALWFMRPSTAVSKYSLDGLNLDNPIRPLNDVVVIKLDPVKESSDGGVIIPNAREANPPNTGTVVDVGPGRTNRDTGFKFGMMFKKGDRVLWGKHVSAPVKYNDEDHLLVSEDSVLLSFQRDTPTLDGIKMNRNHILVTIKKENEPKQLKSGVVISTPASRATEVTIGEVLNVGPPGMARNGVPIPMSVDVGDTVKFRDFASEYLPRNTFSVEGHDCVVIKNTDILATFGGV